MLDNKRICLVSFRSEKTHVSRCSDYEFEDVILAVDDVDLITLEQGASYSLRKRFVNQSVRHISDYFCTVSPSMSKIRLDKNYDLFLVVCEDITDVLAINSIKNWSERCSKSICWIDEVWLAALEKNKRICEQILSRFDYILTGCRGSVSRLQELVKKPCLYMAPGVDMLKYAPPKDAPDRDITFCSIGRRPPALHQQLLDLQKIKGVKYHYDNRKSSRLYTDNYLAHRDRLRSLLGRSRYFIVFPSKFDVVSQTAGQIEFGFRFFEGAAAGTVLIGEVPDSSAFRMMFDWEDSVISLPRDTQQLYEFFEFLDGDEQRLKKISDNNVYQCLLKHDWAYRWTELLGIAGLLPSLDLLQRKNELRRMADLYRPG